MGSRAISMKNVRAFKVVTSCPLWATAGFGSSDFTEKIRIRIWRIFYTNLRILLIQRIEDLSNILARIVGLVCNLVRILDCDFIV
jgi:hypothetical protein